MKSTESIQTNVFADFWASPHLRIYHYPKCRWARKINPIDLIVFKNADEARRKGFVPCKTCRPPLR